MGPTDPTDAPPGPVTSTRATMLLMYPWRTRLPFDICLVGSVPWSSACLPREEARQRPAIELCELFKLNHIDPALTCDGPSDRTERGPASGETACSTLLCIAAAPLLIRAFQQLA